MKWNRKDHECMGGPRRDFARRIVQEASGLRGRAARSQAEVMRMTYRTKKRFDRLDTTEGIFL